MRKALFSDFGIIGGIMINLEKIFNKTQKPRSNRRRIYALDELRGFSVFCMVFYHAFYSFGMIFNISFFKMLLKFFMPAEPFFAAIFIIISGISSNLSHSNISRGAKLFAVAMAVTLVTAIVEPEYIIKFGVLHMLSVSMLIYGFMKKPLSKIPRIFGMIFFGLLFLITYCVPEQYLGIPGLLTIDIPKQLYSTSWLYPIGFPNAKFSSSDYFPLIPWLFAFLFGTYVGKYAAEERFPKLTYKNHLPFFSFLGRHALLIYIAHQPVIFALTYAVKYIFRL